MKYLLIAMAILVSGCSTTVPVVAKFPDAPKYKDACPKLQKLVDDPKLSDISNTININYSTYYECAMKVDQWREWYEIQKQIFEGVK
jgi:hypothetical protein